MVLAGALPRHPYLLIAGEHHSCVSQSLASGASILPGVARLVHGDYEIPQRHPGGIPTESKDIMSQSCSSANVPSSLVSGGAADSFQQLLAACIFQEEERERVQSFA